MDDTASVASDDSDFVVVIPDCFDLDKPLPGFSSIRSTTSLDDPTASIKSRDSHVTSKDDTVPPKVEAPPPRPAERSPPSSSETSPETVRKMTFVPQRITLRQVKDSRLYRNPITMATGLVNTVTDLVDKRVHFGPKKSEEAPPKEESESDSDDSFEVERIFCKFVYGYIELITHTLPRMLRKRQDQPWKPHPLHLQRAKARVMSVSGLRVRTQR